MRRLLAILILPCGCASMSPDGALEKSQRFTETVRWPEEYEPESASFFVHNEIEIAATPEQVWNVLIQVRTWEQWYEGASNIEIQGDEPVLEAGSVFTWTTMGLDFTSTIKEFEPHRRLAWESQKWSISGWHAWLIIPTEDGCILITDEAQNGFLTYLERMFQPNKLRRLHDIWLAEIKRRAEAANALALGMAQ